MRKLSKFTDRQIALLTGLLHAGTTAKGNDLIAEMAYRLVRAGGGRAHTGGVAAD